jgi:hypothetical protein
MNRYNLELNENYTLVDSFYTGPLTEGCGTTCENCGKLITNVAVIKNSKEKKFNVGMDCAETLTNVFGLYNAEMDFNELKSLTAKTNKIKKTNEVRFNIHSDGEMYCEYNHKERGWLNLWSKDMEFVNKYMKHYLSQVENKDKIGFEKQDFNIDLGFERCRPSDVIGFHKFIKVNDEFSVFITTSPSYHSVTKEITGHSFLVEILHPISGTTENFTEYMYLNLVDRITYRINKILFNQYKAK